MDVSPVPSDQKEGVMAERRLRAYLQNPEEWEAAKAEMDSYKKMTERKIEIAGRANDAGFRSYQIAAFMGIAIATAQGWVAIYRKDHPILPENEGRF